MTFDQGQRKKLTFDTHSTSLTHGPRNAIGRGPGFDTRQHTFVSPSVFSRRAVVSYWRKYVHKVLVNSLGGVSLPRKSMARFTVDVKTM